MAEEIEKSKFATLKKNTIKNIGDIKSELKKVIWPNKSQLINNTVTVFACCVIVGIIICLCDGVFGYLRQLIYRV